MSASIGGGWATRRALGSSAGSTPPFRASNNDQQNATPPEFCSRDNASRSTTPRCSVHLQTETHKAFIRSRWMPAWVDAVEYGKFGRATVTATLFGSMDPSLYADFKKDIPAVVNGVENTLKHTEGGTAGPAQMAARGKILDVTKTPGEAPLGSSGIQVRFETDLITKGLRPTRVVRIRPASWPDVHIPREEYLNSGNFSHEDRFPTPAIFPKY